MATLALSLIFAVALAAGFVHRLAGPWRAWSDARVASERREALAIRHWSAVALVRTGLRGEELVRRLCRDTGATPAEAVAAVDLVLSLDSADVAVR